MVASLVGSSRRGIGEDWGVNPATACAQVLADELVRHGVRDAVLCPGSRSAPLAFALHAADADGRLRLHVRTDERTAAFLALGLARGSGRPVPVVTTSGTAVANLHPAVLEASHTSVPLLLLTADRPPELRGSGANQTTEQVGIFGGAVRWQADLGTPDEHPGRTATWRTTVSRAVHAATGARGTQPGPVHLNLPFRDPLVPDGEPALPGLLAGRTDGAPWTAAPRMILPQAAPLPAEPRTLVVVGDVPLGPDDWGAAAASWAQAHGWPLVAEPSAGGARPAAVPHGALLLGCSDWLAEHLPRRVAVVGRATLGRPLAQLLSRPEVDVEVVTGPGTWPDPTSQACAVHPWQVLLTRPADSPPGHWPDGDWRGDWHSAGERVVDRLTELVERWPSGMAVARILCAATPAGAWLFAGASSPVRDLDLATAGPGPRIIASRGLAGIDGCLSTAAGLALTSGVPTYALVGDLTFLHDVGALVIGPHEPRPDLTVVVIDDDGGGIFGLLEPGAPQHVQAFERVFGTPHGADLGGICRSLGVRFTNACTPMELTEAVAAPPAGLSVVRVAVDRAGQRASHADLRAAAAEALAAAIT